MASRDSNGTCRRTAASAVAIIAFANLAVCALACIVASPERQTPLNIVSVSAVNVGISAVMIWSARRIRLTGAYDVAIGFMLFLLAGHSLIPIVFALSGKYDGSGLLIILQVTYVSLLLAALIVLIVAWRREQASRFDA